MIQYWDDGEPPGDVAALIEAFRERNPGVEHELFDERRAGELIAARFGARELAAFHSCAVPSMRADYFRYCAVLALGGLYADVGFRCRAPLRPPLAGVAPHGGVLFLEPAGRFVLNGIFLFAAPGHPLLRLALDVATANVERRVSELVQMVTGPGVFSGLWLLRRLARREEARERVARQGLSALAADFRREAAALAPTAAGRRGIEPAVGPLLAAVGEASRLERAFAGVRVAPLAELAGLVDGPERPLAYKSGDGSWIEWQRQGRTIFR